MAEFNLTIELDIQVLASQPSDSLCIAKRVNGRYTTVFQDAAVRPVRHDQKQLLKINRFTWKQEYQIFAAVGHNVGTQITQATPAVEVRFGQASVFQNNVFQPPVAASADSFPGGQSSSNNSFIAKSVPANLRPGVQFWSNGTWASVYVDSNQHGGTMDYVMTPMNEYMLFWSSSAMKNSAIDESRLNDGFVFSFPDGRNTKSIRFGFATPERPGPGEQPKFYDVE